MEISYNKTQIGHIGGVLNMTPRLLPISSKSRSVSKPETKKSIRKELCEQVEPFLKEGRRKLIEH